MCSSMHLYGRRLGGVELGRPATSQQAPVASQCRTVVVSSSSGLVMAFHGPSYGLSRECAMKVAITVSVDSAELLLITKGIQSLGIMHIAEI